MIKCNLFFFILYCSYLLAHTPYQFHLLNSNQLNRYEDNSIKGQIAHNAVIDIKTLSDSLYFFGTAGGLSYGEKLYNGLIDFGYFNISSIPRGGNPALAVDGNSIAVSGAIDTSVITGTEPKGTGIAYSKDKGGNWTYLPQPIDYEDILWHCPSTQNPQNEWYLNVDSCSEVCYDTKDNPDECRQLFQWIKWGEQDSILSLLVTTEVDNVSYDLDIYNDYIYAASWAGGLRRYPIEIQENEDNIQWEIIPLPTDTDLYLYCNTIDSSYYINPQDPTDDSDESIGGYHNHKAFSVFIDNNGFIWAGTAAGINKGEINGNCIDWIGHYSSWQNNISGNWVIGFEEQIINGYTRIWVITWSAESQGEFNALSYTDDGGETWQITQPAGFPEKVYNLYANSNRIWTASESGLYVSEDGQNWEKYTRPIDDNTGEELLTESVMSVYFSENDNWLWIGTEDGIAISDNDGFNWTIHRFWGKTIYKNVEKMLSAYPNPFLINDHNQVGGDGHVRFIYSNSNNKVGRIDIFDFAMDRVIQLDNSHIVNNTESEVIWNGRNELGDQVTNGVYFCRLSLNGEYYWTKLAVVN